jgi:hypothetical protein
MAYREERLTQAARHVAEGKRIVARHRALIARLKVCGISTWQAEQTLETFLRSQAIFEHDLHELQKRGGGEVIGSQPSGAWLIPINALTAAEITVIACRT